jgi:hypothetical protein
MPPGSTAKACSGTSEALFSPSTRTRDLALGPSLFHWESGRSRRGGCRGWGWQFETAVQPASGRVPSHPESRCLTPWVMATALAASSAWASIPG